MTNNVFKRTPLVLGLALMAPLAAWSQVSISVNIAPPPLPLYAQPPTPGDGYIWTPGYWAWDPGTGDYTWVPGTWVEPPSIGLLWTPGYWAFGGGGYFWHRGYWGSHVGYYGGLNYGYGYTGSGYAGGRWDHGRFRYNSAANNLSEGRVHNVYRASVPQRPAHQESFNGGASPYHTQPTASERRFEGRTHGTPTPAQVEHETRAIAMPEQRMGNNHGVPPTAATPRPGGFGDPQVEHVRGAPEMRAQPERPGAGARPQIEHADAGARPQAERPAAGARPQAEPRGGNRPEGEKQR